MSSSHISRGLRAPGRTGPLALLFALATACGSPGSGAGGPDGGGGETSGPDGSSLPSPAGCGDGQKGAGEECDDGDTEGGDGCDASCEVESGFACPIAGERCVQVVTCGNARIEGEETCDDRNTRAGDGCDQHCQREEGWSCPVPGTACVATECGDGHVAGFEVCDDGDAEDGDGCDTSCKLEEGYHCPSPGERCEETTCGDGLIQGTEECDDENLAVGDGCTPLCKQEPQCSDGTCLAVCGDGVRWDPEECDDGNNLSGDGCDASCGTEQGFLCEEIPLPDPPEVTIPVTIRDFVAACDTGDGDDRRLADDEPGATAPYGHRDFECYNEGLDTGMVMSDLDGEGKPVRADNDSTYDDESFSQWYRSDDDYNRTIAQTLTLPRLGGSGAYRIDSSALFPINDAGFVVEDCGGSPCEQRHTDGDDLGEQNFHFTTEVRYWFEYSGSEELAFSGDDDVWVFINGRLAVDIGGVHGRQDGSVDLGDADVAADLGLEVGGIYEAVVFHAERHTSKSQYRLTLTNFNQAPSTCSDACGDGVTSSREVCDSGEDNGDGDGAGYGGCASDCTLEPYCGDGVVDEDFGEVCDDGLNLGGGASSCAPGCQSLGSECGDGVVQTGAGEQCDDGNAEGGDGCDAACQIEID